MSVPGRTSFGKNGFLSVFFSAILRGWNREEVRGLWGAMIVFMSQKYQSFFDDARKMHSPSQESKLSISIYYLLSTLPLFADFFQPSLKYFHTIIPDINHALTSFYNPI